MHATLRRYEGVGRRRTDETNHTLISRPSESGFVAPSEARAARVKEVLLSWQAER
jgi:hypothetical protein